MKVAQVAPLYESVPPELYGGTERVASYLTEELVKQGHDVTLFASGDSKTSAHLIPMCDAALRMTERVEDDQAYYTMMLYQVFEMRDEFDLIHFHIGYQHFPLSRIYREPHITTMHGRLDLPGLKPLFREFDDMPVVSISDAQRRPLPEARWLGTIYHGLPEDHFTFQPEPDGYLAFLGRISPEKRADRAIEIASRLGMKLRIAAKINWFEQEYHETKIKPLLDANPDIHFMGEITEAEKNEFLGNASALLFPIDWPEPFGLVMIEAMACGTPVVAFRQGSVPEIVDDGKTGFVVDTVDEAVEAVKCINTLQRAEVRRIFKERFSSTRMAENYLEVYQHIAEGRPLNTP